jgi:paraquat-inducible protein A
MILLCACPECDLLHRRPRIARGAIAHCRRCGAILYHGDPCPLDAILALVLAAAILLAITQGSALLELHLAGDSTRATVLGAVVALRGAGMVALAALVGTTALVVPWVELLLLAAMLVPLRFGIVPAWFGIGTRLLSRMHPWNMLEVFLLGVLVALVRLGALADVVAGPAAWSLAGLITILAALAAMLNRDAFWHWREAARRGQVHAHARHAGVQSLEGET